MKVLMMNTKHLDIARKNWIIASEIIGFKILTPYSFLINETKKEAFAFLPKYGSVNGTIIALTSSPEFEMDKNMVDWAQKNECHYSFINIERCLKFNEDYFVEILDDWGKY